MADETRGDDFTTMRTDGAPDGSATPANNRTDAENIGEGAGSFVGGIAGAALGVAGGPIGLVVGALAGAVGGWWAGHGIADALSSQDHEAYRALYESSPDRLADRTYEQVAPAYAVGHLAAHNPSYASRSFDDVESDLQRGWTDDVARRHGQWSAVRGYARTAYEHARNRSAPSE